MNVEMSSSLSSMPHYAERIIPAQLGEPLLFVALEASHDETFVE